MKAKTYRDCAENFRLWGEFVDPDGVDSKEDFEGRSVEQKIAMQIVMFGPEPQYCEECGETGPHYCPAIGEWK